MGNVEADPGGSHPAVRRDAAARVRPDARQDRPVWAGHARQHGRGGRPACRDAHCRGGVSERADPGDVFTFEGGR
jgi:hypothetical protein